MYENGINENANNVRPETGNFSGAQNQFNAMQGQPDNINMQGQPAGVNRNPAWNAEPAQGELPARKAGGGKKPGIFQKILLSVSLGLFFGIFAGIGFYAVQQGTGMMQKPAKQIEDSEESKKATADESRDKGEDIVLKQANSKVIYTNAPSNVSEIVSEVMPAMVSIVNNYTEKTSFWGQIYEEQYVSCGSGIIVAQNDKELLIVTNRHVVKDADKLEVTLIDGTEVEAKIKGLDADMDLAVIAIDLNDLKRSTKEALVVATLGDSDDLVLGEQVIAIGNALGYGQSVTVGYISALDREMEMEDGSVRSFIQTDAAINKGNSGGALLNSAGEVIGINSNKLGGNSIEGMGYAIPITAASPIIADLMEKQIRDKLSDDERGYIGITKEDVTDQIAMMYGMPKGVYVLSVVEGSGAEKAGIIKGDVITKFDGSRITCYEDLKAALQYCGVGDVVKITIMRPERGEYVEHELEITLGEKPSTR